MFITIIVTALTASLFAPAEVAFATTTDTGVSSYTAVSSVSIEGDSITAYVG